MNASIVHGWVFNFLKAFQNRILKPLLNLHLVETLNDHISTLVALDLEEKHNKLLGHEAHI